MGHGDAARRRRVAARKPTSRADTAATAGMTGAVDTASAAWKCQSCDSAGSRATRLPLKAPAVGKTRMALAQQPMEVQCTVKNTFFAFKNSTAVENHIAKPPRRTQSCHGGTKSDVTWRVKYQERRVQRVEVHTPEIDQNEYPCHPQRVSIRADTEKNIGRFQGATIKQLQESSEALRAVPDNMACTSEDASSVTDNPHDLLAQIVSDDSFSVVSVGECGWDWPDTDDEDVQDVWLAEWFKWARMQQWASCVGGAHGNPWLFHTGQLSRDPYVKKGRNGQLQNTSQFQEYVDKRGVQGEIDLSTWLGKIHYLAFQPAECIIIQRVIEMYGGPQPRPGAEVVVAMVSELRWIVVKALQDPHANYVIQKIVEHLPPAMSRFVAEKMCGDAEYYSCHPYSYRVMCRLYQHCSCVPAVVDLGNETVQDSARVVRLSGDERGKHVIQALIKYGSEEQRAFVVNSLAPRSFEYSSHPAISYVLEDAILCGTESQQEDLFRDIGHGDGGLTKRIEMMAKTTMGGGVLKAFMQHHNRRYPATKAQHVWSLLQASAANLRAHNKSRRLLREIGMW